MSLSSHRTLEDLATWRSMSDGVHYASLHLSCTGIFNAITKPKEVGKGETRTCAGFCPLSFLNILFFRKCTAEANVLCSAMNCVQSKEQSYGPCGF